VLKDLRELIQDLFKVMLCWLYFEYPRSLSMWPFVLLGQTSLTMKQNNVLKSCYKCLFFMICLSHFNWQLQMKIKVTIYNHSSISNFIYTCKTIVLMYNIFLKFFISLCNLNRWPQIPLATFKLTNCLAFKVDKIFQHGKDWF